LKYSVSPQLAGQIRRFWRQNSGCGISPQERLTRRFCFGGAYSRRTAQNARQDLGIANLWAKCIKNATEVDASAAVFPYLAKFLPHSS